MRRTRTHEGSIRRSDRLLGWSVRVLGRRSGRAVHAASPSSLRSPYASRGPAHTLARPAAASRRTPRRPARHESREAKPREHHHDDGDQRRGCPPRSRRARGVPDLLAQRRPELLLVDVEGLGPAALRDQAVLHGDRADRAIVYASAGEDERFERERQGPPAPEEGSIVFLPSSAVGSAPSMPGGVDATFGE